MDVVELTNVLVGIGSEGGKEGELEIAKFVKGYLDGMGIASELIEFKKGRADVIASIGSGEGLMLNGHLDTVPIGDTMQWTRDARGEVEGNRVYGRGASDMKGGVAAILCALEKAAKSEAKRRLLVTFVAGEETDFCGSKHLLGQRKGLFKDVKCGIVAEATDLKLQTAQKGIAPIVVGFSGKGAHGSRPWLGESALLKATAFVEEYRRLAAGNGLNDPVGQGGTYNFGRISGGTAMNVVPDSCSVELDRRLADGENPEGALAEVYDALKAAQVTADVSMHEPAMPYKLDKGSRIFPIMADITGGEETLGYGYTEAELYKRMAGIESIVYGPGTKAAIHKPDEYVEVSSLNSAVDAFARVVAHWLSGE